MAAAPEAEPYVIVVMAAVIDAMANLVAVVLVLYSLSSQLSLTCAGQQ